MRHYIITISAAIAAMLWLPSCRKPVAEEIVSPDITGEWKLESAESLGENAVVKASETIEVSVYVAFEEDGTFELYQRLDERRFKRYEGTWTLEGKILSGLYDGKKSTPWQVHIPFPLRTEERLLSCPACPEIRPGIKSRQGSSMKVHVMCARPFRSPCGRRHTDWGR